MILSLSWGTLNSNNIFVQSSDTVICICKQKDIDK